MSSPKITAVQALDGKRLLITFANGIKKIYDCRRIIELEPFRLLRTEAFFRAVKVDAGGYGISWNDEMDLSEHELWENGFECTSDMAASDNQNRHVENENVPAK